MTKKIVKVIKKKRDVLNEYLKLGSKKINSEIISFLLSPEKKEIRHYVSESGLRYEFEVPNISDKIVELLNSREVMLDLESIGLWVIYDDFKRYNNSHTPVLRVTFIR